MSATSEVAEDERRLQSLVERNSEWLIVFLDAGLARLARYPKYPIPVPHVLGLSPNVEFEQLNTYQKAYAVWHKLLLYTVVKKDLEFHRIKFDILWGRATVLKSSTKTGAEVARDFEIKIDEMLAEVPSEDGDLVDASKKKRKRAIISHDN